MALNYLINSGHYWTLCAVFSADQVCALCVLSPGKVTAESLCFVQKQALLLKPEIYITSWLRTFPGKDVPSTDCFRVRSIKVLINCSALALPCRKKVIFCYF